MAMQRDSIIKWFKLLAEELAMNKELLTQLDSDIGDGDHGINMDRGFQALVSKIPDFADKDIGTIFKTAGMILISTIGGASGPLYGTLFIQMGHTAVGKLELTLEDWFQALQSGVDGLIMRGKASEWDKTMLDSFIPALNAFRRAKEEGYNLPQCFILAAEQADNGALATIELVALKGRASYLGERSKGHQDPGARSAALFMKTLAQITS